MKPCLFFLFLLDGWNVLFGIILNLIYCGSKFNLFFLISKHFSDYFHLNN
jgi:hypothetical protein